MLGLFIAATLILILAFFLASKSVKKTIQPAVQQELADYPLTTNGTVPLWLQGSLVRNGPIPVSINGAEIPHWFDGLAMLHSFAFCKGQIQYSNKFLKTDAYREVFERGNLNFGGFATPDIKPFFEKIMNVLTYKRGQSLSNANVNVAKIAKQTVALTEYPLPIRFEITTLNTLGGLKYTDTLPKSDIFESAHPHQDLKTSETINYLINYGKNSCYVIYQINQQTPDRKIISQIPVQNPGYMHSFALTQNKIILVEFPFTVNPLDLLFNTKGYIHNFTWHPERGTRFIVVDRKTGDYFILPYSKAFFAFHHINAFESDDNIIIDIVTYPDASVISKIAKHNHLKPKGVSERVKDVSETMGENAIVQKLTRYTLSEKNKTITENVLLEKSLEFPRINENLNTHPYRYVYLVDPRIVTQKTEVRPLYKFDVTTGEMLTWSEPGLMPGEPVFIANPTGKTEDDGVIMTLVLDPIQLKSFLLLLNGKTLQEISRSSLPFAVPADLHGQFFRN